MQKITAASVKRDTYVPTFKLSPRVQLLLIDFCFMVLFISTGMDKITDTAAFQGAMNKSKLLIPFSAFLSYTVPIIEIMVAVLLAIPNLKNKGQLTKANRIGLRSSFLLMALFTLYTIYTLIAFAKNLPCTCGGLIKKLTWRQHLAVNLLLLLLAAWSILLMRKEKKLTTRPK